MHELVLIGFSAAGMPVYSMRGGAPEGEGENGPEGEGDDNEQDGDDTETEDDYVPPTREEWARQQAALRKASGEAATRRRWLNEAGINPKNGKRFDADEEDEAPPVTTAKPSTKKPDDEEDTSQQVTSAELQRLEKIRRTEGKKAAAREAQLVSALTKSAAKNALVEAGWNGKGADLVERFIDLGDVEIDDDGNVIGLDDQVAELKTSMPDWFKKARPARRPVPANGSGAREVDGADRTGTTTVQDKPKSWLDKLSDQIDGIE